LHIAEKGMTVHNINNMLSSRSFTYFVTVHLYCWGFFHSKHKHL